MDLTAVLDESAARGGIALTVNDASRTFADVADLTRAGAALLTATGARHIVYLAVSGPGYPLALMAAARAGIPFTPKNYRLAGDQIAELLARFDDPLITVDPAYAGAAAGSRN